MKNEPTMPKVGICDAQVCMPKDWTDEQVVEFAKKKLDEYGAVANLDSKPQIRKEGNEFLAGDPERVPCQSLEGFVHIMLDY